MRAVLLVCFATANAFADKLPTAPPAPADVTIKLDGIVREQIVQRPKDPKQALCDAGDKYHCETLCNQGSRLSCARLGMLLALGGADNPLLPVTKFEQDFAGAAIALGKACKLGWLASCVDLQLVNGKLGKPVDQATLRATCKKGYGRACSLLADDISDDASSLALYEQGCNGGDSSACMTVAEAHDELKKVLEWSHKAFVTPTAGKVQLTCGTGTQAMRTISTFEGAFKMIQPKWACGTFDERRRRFVENGAFIEFATEEDEAAYPNGIITERGTKVGGELEGLRERYDVHGKLIARGTYKAGREEGAHLRLLRDEVRESMWANGRLEGRYRSNDKGFGGEARFEYGAHAANDQTGTWLKGEAGKVTSVTVYDKGKPTTNDLFDSKTGEITRRITYDAHGEFKQALKYERGRLTSEQTWEDKEHSTLHDFDEQGTTRRITKYFEGHVEERKERDPKTGKWIEVGSTF